ncbi:MAG: hypothetical protein PVF73_12010, partial [Bacteroidales bacterium]
MKIIYRLFPFSIIFLLIRLNLPAQFYNTGQAPASVRWMQIKTDHFQLIYPEGFGKEANRAANLLEYVYEFSAEDFPGTPKKISVILYNQSVNSNGYVAWAPRRVEWVTTPPGDSYVQDWLEQLALHEYRHVVQLDNLEQGLTRVLNILFGEMATGLVAAYLPFWFLEGDAVVNETAFSSTGRGRSADFTMELRTIELEKEKRYSYDQSYLGSYKYFIPNHYKYGYHMVSYAKLKYNTAIPGKTIDKVGKRPYLGAPFYFALKQNGAGSKTDLYHNAFDSLRKVWKTESIQNASGIPDRIGLPETKHYTNYRYVQPTPYGIFAVRTGIDDITRFVFLKDSSDDVVIHTPGRYRNTPVSAGEKYVVWEEYLPDARWEQKNYSVIKLLELATGNEKQLTTRSRYFSPSLSPSDNKIACIKTDRLNRYSIVILDSFNGEIKDEIMAGEGICIYHPVWLSEDMLAFISMHNNNKQIEQIDIRTGERKVLFSSGLINITRLHASDNILYFTYDPEISRNIYAIDLVSGKMFKITSSKYGADYPYAKNNVLYYSDYSLNGYRPVRLELDASIWESADTIKKYHYSWADHLSGQTGINIQKDPIPSVTYDTAKYNRLLHSFYLHSWTPFYFDVNDFLSLNPEIYPGVTIFSQNKLSTITSSISYYYKDQTHYVKPSLTIERFYPVFELSALFSGRPSYNNGYESTPLPNDPAYYKSFRIRCYLPLDLTRNKFNRFLQPGISYNYHHEYYLTDTLAYKLGYDNLNFNFFLSNLLKRSPKDIEPRLGQTL